MKHKKIIANICFPIIALFSMLLGSQLTNVFSFISKPNNIIDCQLLIVVMLLGCLYFGYSSYILIIAVIIGMIYDLYFYELLGIYTICLPLMIVIFNYLRQYVRPILFNYFLLFMMCHLWMMYSSYFIQVIFKITNPDILSFIVLYLAPSIIVNAILDLTVLLYGERYYLNVTK